MNRWWSQERYSVSKTNAYFITIALVALASVVRIWPLHMLGSYNPYLTYYPAIIISAIIGGFFAGILATSLTCIIVSFLWWFLVSEPFIKAPSDWLALVLFAFSGTLISGIAESMRRANERSQTERKQLELSLNVSQQGYWDLNLKTGLAERSLLHDQIFGYASLLPKWTYEHFLSHVHPDDSRFVDEAFKTALLIMNLGSFNAEFIVPMTKVFVGYGHLGNKLRLVKIIIYWVWFRTLHKEKTMN